MLEQIFGTTGHVGWAQECARAVLILAYGLLALRLSGRRTFGRWAAIDIVVAIIVGSSLSRALTGGAPLFGTLAATTLLLALHWLLAQAVARFQWASRLLEGKGVHLATGGEPDRAMLRRHGVSDADLQESVRQSGTRDVSETAAVILEPSGKISVLEGGRDQTGR
jgi:uncharacterized membrane protein YcaP (DUF421 family)